MINKTENPLEWASLLYELSDAHDHLKSLQDQMSTDGAIDEEDYRVQIAHIYAHINRAWATRDLERGITDSEFDSFREFPSDIKPIA